tara:strand:+ start:910 stop:1167 length:258 start_codon:yes stop_codon:yes gene_type:complete
MSFKNYYLSLSKEKREALANSADTSDGMLTQIAYGHKPIELGFADVLVAKGRGNFSLADLPLTERATKQNQLRQTTRAAKKEKAV